LAAARAADRPPARGPLPPLLRRSRLRDDRRGARDQPRHGRRDAFHCSPRAAAGPRTGGEVMTETRIDELLDELVPVVEPRSDGWEDVLERARTSRRRYSAVVIVALALL